MTSKARTRQSDTCIEGGYSGFIQKKVEQPDLWVFMNPAVVTVI